MDQSYTAAKYKGCLIDYTAGSRVYIERILLRNIVPQLSSPIVWDFKFELVIIFTEIIRGSYKIPLLETHRHRARRTTSILERLLVIKHWTMVRILFSEYAGKMEEREEGGREPFYRLTNSYRFNIRSNVDRNLLTVQLPDKLSNFFVIIRSHANKVAPLLFFRIIILVEVMVLQSRWNVLRQRITLKAD